MPILRMSLRIRLTAWFIVIFASIYLAVLGGMWLLHRDIALNAAYERLVGLAEGVAMTMSKADAELAPGTLHRFQPLDRRHSILAVRDASGEVLVSRWGVDPSMLPPIPVDEPVNEPLLYSIAGADARQLLGQGISTVMVTYRFSRGNGHWFYVDMARMTDIHQEERSFLFDAFIVGAIGALLASVVAAWLIAGRAVAPINQFTEAAREVHPDHLETRLKIGSTDHEIARLQTELNKALSRLEEGYRNQGRFISHVAHDLKTPIAVMLTASQVIDAGKADRHELEEHRQSVIKEMRRLGSLVEGFLMLARADQGDALERRIQVPMNDLVLDSVERTALQAKQAQVRLLPILADDAEDPEPCEVHADPGLLGAMLQNLIRNAIRHTPPGDVVEVKVDADASHCHIRVRDHGPGIDPQYLERVFERGFVVSIENHEASSGLGLGLSIAKTVAELHGGSISARNADGGGCLFEVSLPRRGVDGCGETDA